MGSFSTDTGNLTLLNVVSCFGTLNENAMRYNTERKILIDDA
jgi:hypothetical protein